MERENVERSPAESPSPPARERGRVERKILHRDNNKGLRENLERENVERSSAGEGAWPC